MKHRLLPLVALMLCAVQAQGPSMLEHSTRDRTATTRVTPSPGDALPSDSLDCRLIGAWSGARLTTVVVRNGYAYAGSEGGGGESRIIRIFDVSDPTNLTQVGHYDMPGTSGIGEIVKDGHYLYVAAESAGLLVIDVSNPTTPTLVGNYNHHSWPDAVKKDGDYAYLSDYLGGLLQIINVSDPTDPCWVSEVTTPGQNGYSFKSGDYMYSANQDSGLVVIDVSDTANPFIAGRWDTPGVAASISVVGDYAYMANLTKIYVFNVSDPTTPESTGVFDCHAGRYGNAGSINVYGDYAYVGRDQAGLSILDISDPTDPTEVAYYDPEGLVGGTTRYGKYAYSTVGDSGLMVVAFAGDTSVYGDTTGYGVEEGRRPPACSSQLPATIVRGVLFLTEDRRRGTGDRAALLDAAGRRVMELQPGPNNVQHLSPGVYFASSPGSVEKVLLTR